MKIDFVPVRNTETGEVGRISRRLFENPAINRDGILVEVEADAKPYVKELYTAKPRTKDADKSKASEKEVSD